MPTQRGFTVLELLITVAIISILVMVGYPTYNQHVLKTQRSQAQVALLDLASAMERYFAINHTYMGATLATLEVNEYTISHQYRLEINQLNDNSYLLQAIPLFDSEKEDNCGALGLDQIGRKSITGMSDLASCWNQ
jgi:type IV pilus assembly protein PilE